MSYTHIKMDTVLFTSLNAKQFQFPNTGPFSKMQHTNSPSKLTWFSRLQVKAWQSCTCTKIHLRGGVK